MQGDPSALAGRHPWLWGSCHTCGGQDTVTPSGPAQQGPITKRPPGGGAAGSLPLAEGPLGGYSPLGRHSPLGPAELSELWRTSPEEGARRPHALLHVLKGDSKPQSHHNPHQDPDAVFIQLERSVLKHHYGHLSARLIQVYTWSKLLLRCGPLTRPRTALRSSPCWTLRVPTGHAGQPLPSCGPHSGQQRPAARWLSTRRPPASELARLGSYHPHLMTSVCGPFACPRAIAFKGLGPQATLMTRPHDYRTAGSSEEGQADQHSPGLLQSSQPESLGHARPLHGHTAHVGVFRWLLSLTVLSWSH
ncbi:uncharacterized protein LOC144376946 [Ictidomys tridecemlineatus]